MCGIFGFTTLPDLSPLDQSRLLVTTTLLISAMQERGVHGWGFTAARDGDFVYDKGPGAFFDSCSPVLLTSFPVVVGHTRFATIGEKDRDHAHPFLVADLIGAHNGVIRNHAELNTKYHRQCTVDSQHILHHLAEEKDLAELNGYGAVEWFNLTTSWANRAIYLLRFNTSDLHVATVPDIGTFYCSTLTDLRTALTAAGFSGITYYQALTDGTVHYAAPDALYEVSERHYNIPADRKWESPAPGYTARRTKSPPTTRSLYTDPWDDDLSYDSYGGQWIYRYDGTPYATTNRLATTVYDPNALEFSPANPYYDAVEEVLLGIKVYQCPDCEGIWFHYDDIPSRRVLGIFHTSDGTCTSCGQTVLSVDAIDLLIEQMSKSVDWTALETTVERGDALPKRFLGCSVNECRTSGSQPPTACTKAQRRDIRTAARLIMHAVEWETLRLRKPSAVEPKETDYVMG